MYFLIINKKEFQYKQQLFIIIFKNLKLYKIKKIKNQKKLFISFKNSKNNKKRKQQFKKKYLYKPY